MPVSQVSNISKIHKASEKFEQVYGRSPSPEELEKDIDINAHKIHLILSSNSKSISLETPIKESETGCLLDILPNEEAVSTDSEICKNDLTNSIEIILNSLPYRDRDIVRMSFGIGINPIPNNEIANRFGIGNERVRQLLHSAIKKIKKNYSELLYDLL